MRSAREKVIDKCLLLVGLRDVRIHSSLKLQKFVFLCENELIDRRLRALSYKFFSYEDGPFSSQLAEDRKELGHVGLLREHSLSETGEVLAEAFRRALGRRRGNHRILATIDEVRDKHGGATGTALKDLVYDTKAFCHTLGKRVRVRDIPKHSDIFVPQEMGDVFDHTLSIDDEELESFELWL